MAATYVYISLSATQSLDLNLEIFHILLRYMSMSTWAGWVWIVEYERFKGSFVLSLYSDTNEYINNKHEEYWNSNG